MTARFWMSGVTLMVLPSTGRNPLSNSDPPTPRPSPIPVCILIGLTGFDLGADIDPLGDGRIFPLGIL